MLPETPRVFLAVVMALTIALRGRRRRSLSPSGAAAAFVVGFLSFACATRFGWTMLAFYLSATRATQYKADLKKRLEDGYVAAAGNRDWLQVLASSLPAVVTAVVYYALYRFDAPVTPVFPLKSSLLLAYLLFFAACAGDTFASEIGIAMPGPGRDPVLITAPWRRVPRGTNGGITLEGTLASAVGGFIIGAAFFVTGPEYSFSQLWLMPVGVFGGLVGSAIDSVLGAVVQASWLDTASRKVLRNAPARDKQTGGSYEHICGMDLLSGEVVNALAAIGTAATAPALLEFFSTTYPDM